MPRNSIRIKTTGLGDMTRRFAKAKQDIPNRSLRALEGTLAAAFAATEAKVHVETGRLKASGRHDSHYTGSRWEGEITFRGHPGVFELARGDRPTRNHPEGGHFFFNAVEPFYVAFEADIDDIFKNYFEERAPI